MEEEKPFGHIVGRPPKEDPPIVPLGRSGGNLYQQSHFILFVQKSGSAHRLLTKRDSPIPRSCTTATWPRFLQSQGPPYPLCDTAPSPTPRIDYSLSLSQSTMGHPRRDSPWTLHNLHCAALLHHQSIHLNRPFSLDGNQIYPGGQIPRENFVTLLIRVQLHLK